MYVDDFTRHSDEINAMHDEQRNRLAAKLQKAEQEARAYGLDSYTRTYMDQLTQVLYRAQNADLQLQHKHKLFLATEPQKKTEPPPPSVSINNLVSRLDDDYFNKMYNEYLMRLRKKMTGVIDNISTAEAEQDIFNRNIYEKELKAIKKRIKDIENIKQEDESAADAKSKGNVLHVRQLILAHYLQHMDNTMSLAREIMKDASDRIEPMDLSFNSVSVGADSVIPGSQSDDTRSVVFLSVTDDTPHAYMDYLYRPKTTPLENREGEIRHYGFGAQGVGIIPKYIIYQNSDSTNALYYLRKIDALFENDATRTYVAVLSFFVWLKYLCKSVMKDRANAPSSARQQVMDEILAARHLHVFDLMSKAKGDPRAFDFMNVGDEKLGDQMIHINKLSDLLTNNNLAEKLVQLTHSDDNPFNEMYRAVKTYGNSVYRNIVQIARDRMYESLEDISFAHANTFKEKWSRRRLPTRRDRYLSARSPGPYSRPWEECWRRQTSYRRSAFS